MIAPPITNASVPSSIEPVSISFPTVHGAAIAPPVPIAQNRAIAIARVSIGKISLTVRYAADAPAEAKKKQIDQQIVSVSADRTFSWNRYAVTSRIRPLRMYVDEIITFRPTVSNSGPSTHGPTRFPIANGMM